MEITVTRDDGTTEDITGLVQTAYQMLWEGTRWDRDWEAQDVERLAALARACGYPTAEAAAEIAATVRAAEDEERAQRVAWQRERAESIVAALTACG